VSGDPYVYPGTGVLRNRFGIRDVDELERVEAELVVARTVELRSRVEQPPFDLARLQAIHQHLFGDVYAWAGELRTVRIAKQRIPFANPQFIEQNAGVVFGELAGEDHLVGIVEYAAFVERFAYHLGEVNALHPFREGNGRTQRQLFRELAAHAGWAVDFTGMGRDENIEASIAATLGDQEPLRRMLVPLVHRL
jgi:cell filamentation protein